MPALAREHSERLLEGLIENLRLDFFENDEIIEVIGTIESFDSPLRDRIAALCVTISNASSSLVPNTLKRIKNASRNLGPEDMEKWIINACELLDSQGIHRFIDFISMISEESLSEFRDTKRLKLTEVSKTLETYLRGISGMDFAVATDNEPYTDTDTVYLPPVLSRYGDEKENLLVYILMVAHKWAQLACGTLIPDLDKIPGLFMPGDGPRDLETLFSQFADRELAIDLFTLLEAFMLDTFLREELPGLMERMEYMKEMIFSDRPSLENLTVKTAFVEGIYHYYLAGVTKGAAPDALQARRDRILSLRQADDPAELTTTLMALYDAAAGLPGDYRPQRPVFFFGTVKPERVSQRLKARRAGALKRMEGIISKLVDTPDYMDSISPSAKAAHNHPLEQEREYLAIKGKVVELDEELQKFLRERGGVPGGILVKGSELGSNSSIRLEDLTDEEDTQTMRSGGIKYDEWDFKRGDYNRQWCSLYEQDVKPRDEPFVETTLMRYSGYVTVLRKKFEAIRTMPKVLKRQRDGDSVDIDAAVDAFSDMHAGLPPEDTLFIRVDRQERSIAVLFLVDMSGSTKGWVNDAEKEALVLMCEALEALGDSYAIYGFSGMSRTKCDYYRIKSFDEPYTSKVKRRIAGIVPKDYTRMGAPIRHSATILGAVEARTKFLISISDGKPEDWGAYKGDYGIEDTRRALREVRDAGIFPFCITIDKEAHSYLPHMYGAVNYIVIDNVRKLPGRITEIYRKLTV